MGFFVRKAFRAGPIRFNLSKSGVGVSVGVKGLRLGAGPSGPYLAAGRHGVYLRESLSPPRTRTSSAPRHEFDDRDGQKPTVQQRAGLDWPFRYLVIPGAVGLIITLLVGSAGGAFLTGAVVVAGCVAAVISHNKRTKFARYHALLDRLAEGDDRDALRDAVELRKSLAPLPPELEARHDGVYASAVLRALAEREKTGQLSAWPGRVADAFGLALEHQRAAELDLFKRLVWTALADQVVTSEEQQALEQVRTWLAIDSAAIEDESRALNEHLRAQALERDLLPTVDSPVKLQKGEVCHHHTSGALLDRKVVRSSVVAGRRHKEEALVVAREGDVYVTSKRLLVVGDGTSAIPHTAVLDVEIDYDERLITITKDGRQKPLHLRVPDPLYTGKLIEVLSRVTVLLLVTTAHVVLSS